ncbi:hypothetical protein SARC_11650, partial [Sphaeroforma arctica JP610]
RTGTCQPSDTEATQAKRPVIQVDPREKQFDTRTRTPSKTVDKAPATARELENAILALPIEQWESATMLLRRIVAIGGVPSKYALNSVLRKFKKARQWPVALDIFYEMEAAGSLNITKSYRYVMSVCAKNGQAKRALLLWQEMKEKGVKLDMIVYRSAISAYCRDDKMEEARWLLQVMQRDGVSLTTR